VNGTPSSHSFAALGSTALVAVGDSRALDRARRILAAELTAVDAACSRFRADSELVLLNRCAGTEVRVSLRLLAAVRTALDVAALTGGLVDPTVGATLRLAGYDRTFAEVRLRDGRLVRPTFAPVAGWSAVALDERRRTIRTPRGVELDLGATAKALAADRAALVAAEATGTGVLVGLGGDVAVAGEPPEEGWPIRIDDDHTAPLAGPGPTVSIVDGGLASSGTRVRRWTTSGGELHHIIDPRTARPASTPWRTVTVAAASCVDANAASTAAIVLGEEAPTWLAERRLPARLAAEDGTVATVGGWPAETS
jgi:thiamine biosynthesis lipoprotein